MPAKRTFSTPVSQPALAVAEIESITFTPGTRTITGFIRKGPVDGQWVKSEAFTIDLAELNVPAGFRQDARGVLQGIFAYLEAQGLLEPGNDSVT